MDRWAAHGSDLISAVPALFALWIWRDFHGSSV